MTLCFKASPRPHQYLTQASCHLPAVLISQASLCHVVVAPARRACPDYHCLLSCFVCESCVGCQPYSGESSGACAAAVPLLRGLTTQLLTRTAAAAAEPLAAERSGVAQVGGHMRQACMQHFAGLPCPEMGRSWKLLPRPHSFPTFWDAQTSRACRCTLEWPGYRLKFWTISCNFLARLLQAVLWVVEGPAFYGIPVAAVSGKAQLRAGPEPPGGSSDCHFGATFPDLMTGLGAIERAGGQTSRQKHGCGSSLCLYTPATCTTRLWRREWELPMNRLPSEGI